MAGTLFLPGSGFAQWNPNTSVNITVSGLPMADMQTASTSDSKTWVAFYHETGSNYDMRAQLIDENGFKLLGDDGVLVSSVSSGTATYVFNVCVDASNNLIIGFQYENMGGMTAIVQKIDQNGNKLWGINGVNLGQGLAPNPALLSTGEVIVVWNESSSNTLKMHKITASGSLAWTSAKSILVGSTKTTRGQPVGTSAGKYAVVYQKSGVGINTTLYAQHFDNSGTAAYPPLQLASESTSGARYYSVVADGDTVYCGFYSSPSTRFNSWLQRVNPDGTIPYGMNGSHFSTLTGSGDYYQGETNIGFSAGSPYIFSLCTYSNSNQNQYGVYVQKFLKSTGARLLTDQAKVVYNVSGSMDTQAGSISVIADNPIFMSYISNYKIYAARLDASGNFVWPGNRVEISSTTASAGNAKGRFAFTPDGPDRLAGFWYEKRTGVYLGYAQGISVGGLVGLKVSTQGGVPATITTAGGTLQMVATVYPASASQNVTWSVVAGTGAASISASGLLTAVANGNVWAKAVSVQDPTMMDSLEVTISNQSGAAPTVVTDPASLVTSATATLNGTVTANTLNTTASFEWGLTTAYGNTISAVPLTVTGNTPTAISAAITGLATNTTYHFRAKGANAAGTNYGADLTFTTSGGVGISDNDGLRMSIYPVPNQGKFQLKLGQAEGNACELEVCSINGKRIWTRKVTSLNGTLDLMIDLGNVPSGLYTLKVVTGGRSLTEKFVVQK
jgi:hypothetical protein